jgi:hypothetical protein
MPLRLYMDVHVPYPITKGLRLHNIDVITAQEDGRGQADDLDLLMRAAELGRSMFSQDSDLLRIAADFQNRAVKFSGLIYPHQASMGFGECIERLLILSMVYEDGELDGQVEFL